MGAQHRAGLARGQEDIEQWLVVDLEPVIGHEDLDRAMALLHQRRNVLLDRLLGRIRDDHVKGVVDHGALLGQRVIILHHLRQLHADMLCRERNYRGGAAESGGDGRALEGVGIHDAGRGQLLDMGVAVDAAGQHQLAARIDLAFRRRKPAADRCDGLTGDRDIGPNTSVVVATRPPRMIRSYVGSVMRPP